MEPPAGATMAVEQIDASSIEINQVFYIHS